MVEREGAGPESGSVASHPARPIHRLGIGSARQALQNLLPGDPLGLRSICARRVRQEALLLDEGRLFLRAVARAAHGVHRYRGRPALPIWLEAQVDAAVEDLLREDRIALGDEGSPPCSDFDPACARLLGRLPIAPGRARSIGLAFHCLPRPEREAFRALVVDGQTLKGFASQGGLEPAEALDLVESALRGLSQRDSEAAS